MEGAVAGTMTPLTAAEFEPLMAQFAPFEPRPRLAVACSGGGDSMALVVLADAWARARDGEVTALIVDHRLRAESAREAADVAGALAARGIAHRILVCAELSSAANLEDAARRARYQVLERWCEEQGVLHLLTAHQRDDEAETVLMRLARGSGLDGLCGIAPESVHRACRVLRPLLDVPPERLRATLRALGIVHVEDPMNRDPAFQRVRLRSARAFLAEEGLSAERLAATAAHLRRARMALEAAVAGTLAHAVALDPCGFATIDVAIVTAAPTEVGLRALAAVLSTIGGADYPPRLESLERLYGELADDLAGGRTLGGCRLVPKAGRVLVCREPAAVAASQPLSAGDRLLWDGRFAMAMPAAAPAGLTVAAVGDEGAVRLAKDGCGVGLPAVVRATLPGLFDADGFAAAPTVGWRRADVAAELIRPEIAVFAPRRPLAGWGLTVV
jgi:tRNA(Ile)-lysidine synthase